MESFRQTVRTRPITVPAVVQVGAFGSLRIRSKGLAPFQPRVVRGSPFTAAEEEEDALQLNIDPTYSTEHSRQVADRAGNAAEQVRFTPKQLWGAMEISPSIIRTILAH